jgi:exopolyphosphatase/guanosine-5'-triphosphate,3'-diphosphate pyrophosphatase
MTAEQRIALPGLETGREDLMMAGILMVLVIMDIFGSDISRISDNGLREGLALAAATKSP